MEARTVSDTKYIFEQTPDNDTFGGRLYRARDAAGLTSRDLASRLSVNLVTVRAWESDRSAPTARRLTMMAGLLGVSLSWLLQGVGPGPAVEKQPEGDDALAGQLEKLKLLQADVADIIVRMERQIESRPAAA